MGFKDRAVNLHGGFVFFIVHTVLRFFQFVLACTVLGLYGTDLNNARIHGVKGDSKWVFAEIVGGIAAVTSLVYLIPILKWHIAFGWDWVIFVLWLAVFGVFGSMYIHENPEGDSGVQRMKNAVWVDLVNMLLWLTTAIYSTLLFFKTRTHKSLHTGRANV